MAKDWFEQTFEVNQLYRVGDPPEGAGENSPFHSLGKIRALVYGEEGSGKTRFCGTFPNPFFIDSDRGLATIRKVNPTAHILPIERGRGAYTTVLKVIKDAVNLAGPFAEGGPLADVQTIVLDGYSALAEALIYEIVTLEGSRSLTSTKPTWDDYNALKQRLVQITTTTQNLTHHHFVATSWDEIKTDETGKETEAGPLILGGFSKIVGRYFDEVYYMNMRKVQGEYVYEAHSKKFRGFPAKSRIGVPAVMEDPTFQTLEKAYMEALR